MKTVLKWFDCLGPICTALLIAQVNEGFTSGVITLLGRAASIEASRLNRVGLWSCPCKLTWGFIKQFSKAPNPAMCRQTQVLELEPHWISLFIWIKISLDTRSAKSEATDNELLCAYRIKALTLLRSWPEKHFLQYEKVKLAISFADSFIFSNKGNVYVHTLSRHEQTQSMTHSLSVISHKGKLLKSFFPPMLTK